MNTESESQALAYLLADDLTQGYADRRFSPLEVTQACLSRIDAFNKDVNAFCFVDSETALKRASESEDRWHRNEPLSAIDGVPATTKDTTMVEGWISSYGSRVFAMKAPAKENSPCVDRLREAGAILLGLTNSPEIGWKGVTDSPLHGVTRNPWNTNMTPGGSSGGAAVAAALGMGCLHIGTDAGGSIRIPAGFTGVFGHKPSFGRVPNYPPSAFSALSHVGPITRSVGDAARMLTVLSGRDTRDWYALPYMSEDYAAVSREGVAGLKVAFGPRLGGVHVDDDVAREVRKAAEFFESLGANVEERDLDVRGSKEILETYWHGALVWRLSKLSDDELDMLDPGLVRVFRKAQHRSLVEYMDACQKQTELGFRANSFHENYDLLLTPTLPIAAFTAGMEIPEDSDYDGWLDWAPFCYPFNLTRQPACSIPCGFTTAGLPIGLQIVGRQYDDATVLRAAAAFEAARPPKMPIAPIAMKSSVID